MCILLRRGLESPGKKLCLCDWMQAIQILHSLTEKTQDLLFNKADSLGSNGWVILIDKKGEMW